jgi:hypothetical protein
MAQQISSSISFSLFYRTFFCATSTYEKFTVSVTYFYMEEWKEFWSIKIEDKKEWGDLFLIHLSLWFFMLQIRVFLCKGGLLFIFSDKAVKY